MEGMDMTGAYEHSIDGKGRMFVPAKLRDELGTSFHMAVGSNKANGQVFKYLVLYPESAWQALREKVAALPSGQAATMDVFFAYAADCEPDSQWRIQIPAALRAYADLDKDVVVAGDNDKAKIWNRDSWNAKNAKELDPENVAAIMDMLGI